jgi:hypothetical protein
MRGVIRYVGWEILAIHALTGLLFVVVNALMLRALLPGHWGLALGLAPLLIWSWWGFFAEARFVPSVARPSRWRSLSMTPGPSPRSVAFAAG